MLLGIQHRLHRGFKFPSLFIYLTIASLILFSAERSFAETAVRQYRARLLWRMIAGVPGAASRVARPVRAKLTRRNVLRGLGAGAVLGAGYLWFLGSQHATTGFTGKGLHTIEGHVGPDGTVSWPQGLESWSCGDVATSNILGDYGCYVAPTELRAKYGVSGDSDLTPGTAPTTIARVLNIAAPDQQRWTVQTVSPKRNGATTLEDAAMETLRSHCRRMAVLVRSEKLNPATTQWITDEQCRILQGQEQKRTSLSAVVEQQVQRVFQGAGDVVGEHFEDMTVHWVVPVRVDDRYVYFNHTGRQERISHEQFLRAWSDMPKLLQKVSSVKPWQYVATDEPAPAVQMARASQ